ncbi:hypothetical protein [Vibrio rhodolitus]|uniref:hypothetical protein n=1 Tax=Vibrio rhodolitus TaxID=2231649 RepID=UPI000E0A76FD|nr:hypothetical protein [Vibrio rhodolitus]
MFIWSITGLVIFFAIQYFSPSQTFTTKRMLCAFMSCVLGPLMLIAAVGSQVNANCWVKRSASV